MGFRIKMGRILFAGLGVLNVTDIDYVLRINLKRCINLYHKLSYWSRSSVVGIAIGYGLDN